MHLRMKYDINGETLLMKVCPCCEGEAEAISLFTRCRDLFNHLLTCHGIADWKRWKVWILLNPLHNAGNEFDYQILYNKLISTQRAQQTKWKAKITAEKS